MFLFLLKMVEFANYDCLTCVVFFSSLFFVSICGPEYLKDGGTGWIDFACKWLAVFLYDR